MKKLIFAFLIFLTATLTMSPATATNFSPGDVCARSISEYSEKAFVSDVVAPFGGINYLLGHWKLSGLAGNFVSVEVHFFMEADKFFVRVNQDPKDEVWLCRSEQDSQTLRLLIPYPADPKNHLILIKATGNPNQIAIAGVNSGWKYKSFKRVLN